MKKKQFLSLALACAMGLSLVACGGNNAGTESSSDGSAAESTDGESTEESSEEDAGESIDPSTPAADAQQEIDAAQYSADSDSVYDTTLGEFHEFYEAAQSAGSVSERHALFAIAEAKLMESGVLVPLYSLGGRYAITKVAPYSGDYVLWGSDINRYHQRIVTEELIKAEDVNEMRAHWTEVRGTGTYEQWAKDYLKEKGYTVKDTYNIGYSTEPVTWDLLSSDLQADSEPVIQTYDGLVEYDCEGFIQPALAESWEVSEDGLTYTFHIRQGAVWVDSQGRKVDDVTADDFVAGMQHLLDTQCSLYDLINGLIVGVGGYASGEITDFAEVGVKAEDDYTLVYTLEAPCTYFETMLGYSIFAPMSRTYYESQGGKFGADFDAGAEDYNYGKNPDSIAYCGPYLVTNHTEQNTIVYQANDSYWNKDNINIKTLTWLWNDNSDELKAYNDTLDGTIDGCSLSTAAIEQSKTDGNFDEYAYTSTTDATTYTAYYNINRHSFSNANDATAVRSAQTVGDAQRTNAAMSNAHFRRALSMAFDRASYRAQFVGEDLKLVSLRNSYTPWNFAILSEDVTVDINGTATSFPAGTYYGEIMQAQIDADGIEIKVYDPSADGGAGSGDGYDGWYNPTAAVAELDAAVEELAAEGVTVDESNPIYIDLPYNIASTTRTNGVNAWKQSLESVLGGKVILNLVECADSTAWNYSGYYTENGFEANYDIYDLSGWGPDYGDPASFLDTMLPGGSSMRFLGIY